LTKDRLETILNQYVITDNNIKTISPSDANYPKLLGEIHDPPKILYFRGDVSLLHSPCLGVVGTRKLSLYGKEVTEYFVTQLVQNGFTVVSGLALGIDAVAHRTALKTKGNTIAVLGTGIDDKSIYPKDHIQLIHEILENRGLIISEYKPGTGGSKWTFPARNRIISGLSYGVVVVEADYKSGALITAKCALDQNRDVFAIPGNVFSQKSNGTNMLIQNGAKLVHAPCDILEEYEQQIISDSDDVQKRISTKEQFTKKDS